MLSPELPGLGLRTTATSPYLVWMEQNVGYSIHSEIAIVPEKESGLCSFGKWKWSSLSCDIEIKVFKVPTIFKERCYKPPHKDDQDIWGLRSQRDCNQELMFSKGWVDQKIAVQKRKQARRREKDLSPASVDLWDLVKEIS